MRPMSASSALRGPPLTLCDIIQRGYLSHVAVLVNLGIRLDSRDPSGRTPLMLTAYVEPEEWGVGVARMLIEEGVCMKARDRQGMTALHHACVYERLQLVQVLLKAPDFDLAQKDRSGNTALHYAAMSGNDDLVALLTSHFQKYRLRYDTLNKHDRTAREEALERGHADCAELLTDVLPPAAPAKENTLAQDNDQNILVVLTEDHNDNTTPSDTAQHVDYLKPSSLSGIRRVRSANWSRKFGDRHLPRPSLPALSVNAWKSGDSTQRRSLPNFRGNKQQSDDSSTTSEKTEDRRTSEGSVFEKPPPGLNNKRRKSSMALRERTNNLLQINGRSMSSVFTPKQFLCPLSRRPSSLGTVSSHTFLPCEKDPEKIIHVASEHDFRNTREFVLKVTKMTPVSFDTECMPGVLPPNPSAPSDNQNCAKKDKGGSWRDAMRHLYHNYEHQWSPSWRKAASPPPSPAFLMPGPLGDEGEELKERKYKRSGSQISELSTHSISRLRKLNAARRRVSNCGLPPGANRSPAPDPGRDGGVTSPDAVSGGTCPPLTRKKHEVKAGHGTWSEGPSRQSSPKPPADNSRRTPSPDNSRTFITHDPHSNHTTDDASTGNGRTAMTGRDWNFRQGTSAAPSYTTVPAVRASLVVDGQETDAQVSNAEPTAIDTNKLYVFSDVEEDDDDGGDSSGH